jgi:hypothetical protein
VSAQGYFEMRLEHQTQNQKPFWGKSAAFVKRKIFYES